MTETFRTVPCFENYEVSNLGRVRNLTTGDFLHTYDNGRAVIVQLSPGHKADRKSFSLGALVLLAFVGPRPEGMECRHLDGNRHHNDPSNLRWGTSAENMTDKERHGQKVVGERHGRSKLTWMDVGAIRDQVLRGKPHKDVAAAYGTSRSNIGLIVNYKTWKPISIQRLIKEPAP